MKKVMRLPELFLGIVVVTVLSQVALVVVEGVPTCLDRVVINAVQPNPEGTDNANAWIELLGPENLNMTNYVLVKGSENERRPFHFFPAEEEFSPPVPIFPGQDATAQFIVSLNTTGSEYPIMTDENGILVLADTTGDYGETNVVGVGTTVLWGENSLDAVNGNGYFELWRWDDEEWVFLDQVAWGLWTPSQRPPNALGNHIVKSDTNEQVIARVVGGIDSRDNPSDFVLLDNRAPGNTSSGAGNGTCQDGQSGVCCGSCGWIGTTQLCRGEAAGGCDIAEYCSGESSACPTDEFLDTQGNLEGSGLACGLDNDLSDCVRPGCDGTSAACGTIRDPNAVDECEESSGYGPLLVGGGAFGAVILFAVLTRGASQRREAAREAAVKKDKGLLSGHDARGKALVSHRTLADQTSAELYQSLTPVDKVRLHHNLLIDLMTEPGLSLMKAVLGQWNAASAGLDDLVVSLVHLFEWEKKAERLLRHLLIEEFSASTLMENSALRSSSLATRALSGHFQLIGAPYLKATLRPWLREWVENPTDVELDPALRKSDDLPEEPVSSLVDRLTTSCNELVSAILLSQDKVPEPVVGMLQFLLAELKELFGDDERAHEVLLSVVVLRWFCPTIANPPPSWKVGAGTAEELATGSRSVARKGLLTVSKVLQGAANGVSFDLKQPHLSPMTGWANSTNARLGDWLKALLGKVKSTAPKPPLLEDFEESTAWSVLHVHGWISEHLTDTVDALKSLPEATYLNTPRRNTRRGTRSPRKTRSTDAGSKGSRKGSKGSRRSKNPSKEVESGAKSASLEVEASGEPAEEGEKGLSKLSGARTRKVEEKDVKRSRGSSARRGSKRRVKGAMPVAAVASSLENALMEQGPPRMNLGSRPGWSGLMRT